MIRFSLPLPPKELSPNSGERHWSSKVQFQESYKRECAYTMRALRLSAVASPCHLTLSFRYKPRAKTQKSDGLYRPLDCDNAIASCKYMIDAMVAVGLIKDDTYKYVAMLTAEIIANHTVLCDEVMVTITPLKGEENDTLATTI